MVPAFSRQSSPTFAPEVPAQNASSGGSWIALAIVGLMFGRLIEFMPGFTAHLRPALLLFVAASVVAVLTGRIGRVASSLISYWLLGFTFWSGLGVPFAVWRGGAAQTWMTYWLSSMLAYVAVISLTDSVAKCRKAMYTIAGSMA